MRAPQWRGTVLLTAVCSLTSRPAAAGDPGKIIVYSGYGTPRSFVVSGRVIEDEGEAPPTKKQSRLRNLVDTIKTLESDEIIGACVAVKVGSKEYISRTDDDGVWRVEATDLNEPLPVGSLKIDVDLLGQRAGSGAARPEVCRRARERLAGHTTPPATGTIHVLADSPGIAVISDFDDTVVESGVTNKARLLYRTLTRNAADMKPVPGAASAFAAAAQSGARGFFYVSGSPQNLYLRITAFLALHEMPPGPILLKNFGSDELAGQEAYKKARIRALLDAFPKLKFLLVGDSGERDPEIYAAVRKQSPDRIAGIVIRLVSGADNDRARFTDMVTIDHYGARSAVLADFIAPVQSPGGKSPNKGVME